MTKIIINFAEVNEGPFYPNDLSPDYSFCNNGVYYHVAGCGHLCESSNYPAYTVEKCPACTAKPPVKVKDLSNIIAGLEDLKEAIFSGPITPVPVDDFVKVQEEKSDVQENQ